MRQLARRAFAPIDRFLAIEASSSVLLLCAAAFALIWANSPWRKTYAALWQTPLGFRLGRFSFEHDLHFWINDVAMTVFFFVIGLEIRRELERGELSTLRRAALPLAAALGGMLVPGCIFLLLNWGRPAASGWGIPMATDVAFAVGILALLGRSAPPGLRILLLALAVIDDVGAIVVIALFYSSGVSAGGFLILSVGLIVILLLQLLGVRRPWAYVPPAVVVWAGTYSAGIHSTLAGVALGLLTPARAWFGPHGFAETVEASAAVLRMHSGQDEREVILHLKQVERARREAVSPLERLEHALHPWVAFGAMPLFALANAGVSVGEVSFDRERLRVFLGVTLGLVVGKPLGVLYCSWLARRARLASLPAGITGSQAAIVGTVAGIGFTMSMFIAELAFPAGATLETAKLGVLVGSALAALVSYMWGRLLFARRGTHAPRASDSEPRASPSA
jgi:NhaA family Na+:H+ antiporter